MTLNIIGYIQILPEQRWLLPAVVFEKNVYTTYHENFHEQINLNFLLALDTTLDKHMWIQV